MKYYHDLNNPAVGYVQVRLESLPAAGGLRLAYQYDAMTHVFAPGARKHVAFLRKAW